MSLPTSGYTAAHVDYFLTLEGAGNQFSANVTVNAQQIGESKAEEVIAILEPALLALAGDLESVTGVTVGRVYKSLSGGINYNEIS